VANDLRPIDGNGHVPDEPVAECACCLREDPAYQAGYQQAVLDMVGKLAEKGRADLDRVLERLQPGPHGVPTSTVGP